MNDVKYSTAEEKRLITAIQRAVGALDNGYIGTQTLSDIANTVGAAAFPLAVRMYGYPVLIGKDIKAFNPKGALTKYSYSMLGSFTYPRATTPCSILVNGGVTVCGAACHAFAGKPESVIYKTNAGRVGIARVKSSSELPAGTVTAVGGMGLLDNYNPTAEGFSGAYADVLRQTNHNVLGYKRGLWYGVYFPRLNAQAINIICRDRFQFEFALLLDGGGLAAMNGPETFTKINNGIQQGYAIQFIG